MGKGAPTPRGPGEASWGGKLTFCHGQLGRLHLITEKHLLSLEENGCLSHCCKTHSCLPPHSHRVGRPAMSGPMRPAALTFPARTRRPVLGSKSGIRGLRGKRPHWRDGKRALIQMPPAAPSPEAESSSNPLSGCLFRSLDVPPRPLCCRRPPNFPPTFIFLTTRQVAAGREHARLPTQPSLPPQWRLLGHAL